jgi:hypothetical protein
MGVTPACTLDHRGDDVRHRLFGEREAGGTVVSVAFGQYRIQRFAVVDAALDLALNLPLGQADAPDLGVEVLAEDVPSDRQRLRTGVAASAA